MNLVIKAVDTEYEDTYFTNDLNNTVFYGVYNWVESEYKTFNQITKKWRVTKLYPDAYEWIAAFVSKEDAEHYLNWKKSQNV